MSAACKVLLPYQPFVNCAYETVRFHRVFRLYRYFCSLKTVFRYVPFEGAFWKAFHTSGGTSK